jgi:hypothetical protein
MEYKNKSVPLSYMKDFDDGKIAWNVDLPDYIDDESISLNISRLRNISQLAGLKRLEINSEHSINKNEVLADYNQYEEAISNIVIYQDDDDYEHVASEYKWDYGEVTVNSTELYANALRQTSEEDNVTDSNLWSNNLNSTIKSSMLEISKIQLTSGISGIGKLNAASAVAIGSIIGLSTGSIEAVVPAVLGISLVNQTASAIYHQGYGESLPKRRLSLLPSYQLDRLLVVKSILKYRDLIETNNLAEVREESI